MQRLLFGIETIPNQLEMQEDAGACDPTRLRARELATQRAQLLHHILWINIDYDPGVAQQCLDFLIREEIPDERE